MAIESHINTRNIESTPWSINDQFDGRLLKRLADISEDKSASALVQLTLQREARNEIRISGQVNAEISMICQRCLQNYVCKIAVEIDEIFTEQNTVVDYQYDDDEASKENEESDYFNSEGHFQLHDYIEDEVLLAVPTFPAHPNKEHCDSDMIARLQNKTTVKEERKNPFSVLKNLK